MKKIVKKSFVSYSFRPHSIENFLWSGNKNIRRECGYSSEKLAMDDLMGQQKSIFIEKFIASRFLSSVSNLIFWFTHSDMCRRKHHHHHTLSGSIFFWKTNIFFFPLLAKLFKLSSAVFFLFHSQEIKFYFILFTTTIFLYDFIKVRKRIRMK